MTASNEISSWTARPAAPPRNEDSSSSTAERFSLAGPSLILDARVHAYRRDLADVALAGQLFAPHYARALVRQCGSRPTFVFSTPSSEGQPASELLPGEEFAVLEFSGRWAWGYCRHDHYVGYVEAIALVEPQAPTHIVAAAAAPILPESDVHAPAIGHLPMGSRVSGHEGHGFLATDSGFIPYTHVRELGAWEHDPVHVAERLLGSPYLLGGRSIRGIDCSGLVQLSLGLCGTHAPRDSDQQHVLGERLDPEAPLQHGDLVFFHGHVALMMDEARVIHATAHSGHVTIEPLEAVASRTAIVERRRLR
ncbi:NlpC/P60 family protein [Allosphingosinicella sp.]|uniref:C40 family peptidase n=1 Tax=Allosphingosinicella sp. TaxID=2823234 RepID=UPI002FC20D9F